MTRIPINLPAKQNFEESQVIETFLKIPENQDLSSRRIVESSIVRTGGNRAFTYTHKILVESNGQTMLKKRSISASEYIEMENQRRTDIKPLISTRLCTIFEGLYMIVDWYEHVKGQPLTCIIQVNFDTLKETNSRIQLPSYVQDNIEKDITDVEEYSALKLA